MPRRGHYDIPLKRDATGRFLPWLIALMVYLATLAVAAAMVLSDLAARWDSGLSGSLTVQVSPLSGSRADPLEERVAAAVELLRRTPGVAEADALPMSEAARLVQPWLGDGALVPELPLPALIDVTLAPRADVARIRQQVTAAVPGATVEEPGSWLADLRRLAATVQFVAVAVVGLIGGAAVAAVVFAANAGLAMHREEVELLHVLGAADRYVAGQFQRHVVGLTLLGGGIGGGLAAATLFALDRVSSGLESALLPPVALTLEQWASLLAVPALAGVLAALTARLTVMRALERLP
ncbi:MAG TPA: hypothetical protein VEB20_02030 [Azospirillaceae bacterium]|nr:hypothetical protein [Azospirillaceae bacterium]